MTEEKAKTKMNLHLLFLVLPLRVSLSLPDEIPYVTNENFKSITENKQSIFLYVEGDGECTDCKLLYHKFVTAMQTFKDNYEIFFGRVADKVLVDLFEVDVFPEVVYYELKSATPRRYRGGITAIALENLIGKVVLGKTDSVKKQYSVELTVKNFDEILDSPDQYRLVMLHEHDDEEEIKTFEEIAKTYDNEKEIVVARIDVDKQKPLRREFVSIEYPCFYWYSQGKDTKRKRYGGELDLKLMVNFVNTQTGFQRLPGGNLGNKAGLVNQMNKLIQKYIEDIYKVKNLDTLLNRMNKILAKLEKVDVEFGEYYIHCVEEVKEDKTIDSLGEERNRLYRNMDDEDVGPLQMDKLAKKLNIVNSFIDYIGRHLVQEMSPGNMDMLDTINLDKESDYAADASSGKKQVMFHEEF